MNKPKTGPRVKETIDLLARQARQAIRGIRRDAMEEAREGNYVTSQTVVAFAEQLETLAGNVDKLVKHWQCIVTQHDTLPAHIQPIISRHLFHNGRNDGLSQRATYCYYLLEALDNMGGRARAKDVVAAVQPKIGGRFTALSKARKIMVYEDGKLGGNMGNFHSGASVVGRLPGLDRSPSEGNDERQTASPPTMHNRTNIGKRNCSTCGEAKPVADCCPQSNQCKTCRKARSLRCVE